MPSRRLFERIIIYPNQSKILFKKGADDDGTNSRIQWFKSKAHEQPRERHKLATKGSESSGQQRIKQHSGQSSLSAKTKVKEFLICSTKQETNEAIQSKTSSGDTLTVSARESDKQLKV